MGLIIDGKNEDTPGLRIISWRDEPSIPRLSAGDDSRRRSTRWVRGIVLHTTKGVPGGKDLRPQLLMPGTGPRVGAGERCARFWSKDPKQSGAHLIVDFDGTIVQVADLLLECAYHAGPVNDVTIGIEIYQGDRAEMYEGQLDVVVKLCDWLTRRFGIQRQIPERYEGVVQRLASGGRDVVGIYGHRDVTRNRGAGDPGNLPFAYLALAGYERMSFSARQDIEVWALRQHDLGIAADGIAGPATVRALAASGRKHGLWVARPSD